MVIAGGPLSGQTALILHLATLIVSRVDKLGELFHETGPGATTICRYDCSDSLQRRVPLYILMCAKDNLLIRIVNLIICECVQYPSTEMVTIKY